MNGPVFIPVAQRLAANGLPFLALRIPVERTGLPLQIAPEHLTLAHWGAAANDGHATPPRTA